MIGVPRGNRNGVTVSRWASGVAQSRRWSAATTGEMATSGAQGAKGPPSRREVVVPGHLAEGAGEVPRARPADCGGPSRPRYASGATASRTRPEEDLPGAAAGHHFALYQGLGQHSDQGPVGGKQILGGGLDLREIETGELSVIPGLLLVGHQGRLQKFRCWLAGTGASQGVAFPRR